ncbi:unnamed protein product [Acanthoscelides obtectus]|uniref:Uncharacterized protein n=1 Tax=Acanthoscelides obtectus TaxID=200917 RepID=A0A9P0Q9U1_ACAOB|nr:unnamed protein product [Acanthoscelides obtectus]
MGNLLGDDQYILPYLSGCDLVCEFLHTLESCTDPGQLTSTFVKIYLASQVACTFKLGNVDPSSQNISKGQ